MTRTAYDEFYGVGVDQAISANYVMRLTYGENGASYYVLRPSGAGLFARLPFATVCRQWDRFVVANHGSHSLDIKDVLGTTVAIVAVGERAAMTLTDNTTIQGTWVKNIKTSAVGTTLVHDRVPLLVGFGTWAGTGVNLRSYCNTALRYDGSKPAAIYCRMHGNIVIGSESPLSTQPAFDTGLWPSGTTLLLEIEAGSKILGKGGQGGQGGGGGGGLFGQPGQQGGTALVVSIDTALVNYGTICGGGGGGGGGASPPSGGGGGGGGGCGYQPSTGGAAGGGAVVQGFPGFAGAIGVGGPGGAGSGGGSPGGAGGSPTTLVGADGLGGGGIGGAAGNAIVKLSTITLNKIVAGTIIGAEVTV